MVGKDAFRINKFNINSQVISGVILGAGVLLGGAAFLHPFSSESSYAADSDVSVSYSGEDWVISAPTSTAADAGGLEFDIEGNPSGVNMAKKDTVTAGSTNVPNYQIYVSVDTEGGKIPNTSNSEYSIAATSGTVTDATDSSKLSGADTLSNNSWGYALSSFNSNINYNDLVSSSSSEAWSSSKWSKLPYIASTSKDDEDAIESTAAKIYDSTTGSGGSVDVYYAVNANNDLASGEYQTTVTYTLIGEMPKTTLNSFDDAASDGSSPMQNVDTDTCANTKTYENTGKTYTLTDSRDNSTYTVRKLKDGKCWMTQNLRLINKKITSADSDVSSDFTIPASSNSTGTGDGNWCNANDSACYDRRVAYYNNDTTYGAYYNWYTATAGTGTYNTSSGNVGSSICPKNWHLPTGGAANASTNEWYNLMVTNYGYKDQSSSSPNVADWTTTAINLPFSGFVNNGSLVGTGSDGYFWSSTAYNSGSAYRTYVYSVKSLGAGTDGNLKWRGFSVRCVLPSS